MKKGTIDSIYSLAQSAVTDSAQSTLKFLSRSGIQAKITRTAHAGCCEACAALAGSWVYGEESKEIYRRHKYCTCTVSYDPGNGRVQNVHSKTWTRADEADKIKARKAIGASSGAGKTADVRKRTNMGEVSEPDVSDTEARKIIGLDVGGITIQDVAKHFLERMKDRKIQWEDVLNAVNNPLKIGAVKDDLNGNMSVTVVGEKVTIIINPQTGKLVTTYRTHSGTVRKLRGEGNDT